MNNWKVIFATVVIFGAGVLTGGLLVNYVQHPNKRPPHNNNNNKAAANAEAHLSASNRAAENAKLRPPELLSKQFLQQLDAVLHMEMGQRESVQKIITEGQNQIRKVIQDARLEIREILTPEQRKQFDDLVKRPFRKPIFGTNTPASSSAIVCTNGTAI